MTITLNSTILYYWLAVSIFEAVYFYISWRKFKKQARNNQFVKILIEVYKSSPSCKLLLRIVFNPATILIIIGLFILFSPLSFIWSLIAIFKKAIGYKSKLQKESDIEIAEIERAKKKSEEFMKNEGRGIFDDEKA